MPNFPRENSAVEKDCVDRPTVYGAAQYNRLLEKLPAAAYTVDADGLITYFNGRAAEIWGREPKLNDPRDRYCGSLCLYSTEGKAIRHDECHMALALKDGREYDNLEVVIERPDGSKITALVHAHPLRDDAGRIVGAANVLIDISDRKTAEAVRGRLAAVVESAEDAIIAKDLEGVITNWNSGAQGLFGYATEEAVGEHISLVVPPERANEERDILRRIRGGEAVKHYETVRRRKDGTLLDVSLSESPIPDADGRIIGASSIARDISERRRMEERLKKADRHKDEFLAMLSHELRNPLAAISYSVQLLRLQPESITSGNALEPLERQVNVLARLLDDLLDVSRVSSGRVHLNMEVLRLNEIVEQAVATARAEVKERGQELRVSAAEPEVWLSGDAVRLEQIIVNLLINAIKYTPNGGRIEIIADREGDDAVLKVGDSGIGLSPDMLAQLFDLFSQGARSLDRAQGGLGVGLALVRHLTELHGGTVTAASEGRGRGSEFTLRLPAVAAPQLSDRKRPGATQPTAPAASGLRVLVVDDHQDNADIQATLLRYNGHDVFTAYDGATAVKLAVESRPHAMLLDIGLPEIDGYEVAWRIRQEEFLDEIVLIAMTGYGQAKDIRRSEAAGFDYHLVKPARFAEVQAILEKVRAQQSTD